MLQDIRANTQGTIAKIIIGLIVISFSIFGIESLLFSGGGSAPAEVNGEEITQLELQQELSVQQRQLLAMLGDNADPALLDDDRLSRQALETLVQREIVKQGATGLNLSASDQVVGEMIASMEQFQIDGQFSMDMFQSMLASAGFTPSLFQKRLAEDVQIGQLRAGLAGSDFTTDIELDTAARILMEGRDVRYISLPLLDFLADAEVSDEQIQAYYEQNSDAFMSEEAVVLEYLDLTLDTYIQPIPETRLREEFELVRDEYELATEARVSHILFEGADDDRQRRVSEVLDVLASGVSFEDAAREYSDDIGSAQSGGDLGYTAGDTFPEPMEEAIARLAVGERSEAVETDAGTHIILLTDRREGTEVSFEDVAAQLKQDLQQSDAAAALIRDVERLRDLVFNAADLKDPAEELSLSVQRSGPVGRGAADDIFARPGVQQAIFSDDVLEAGHNSEVIEVSPEQFIALRVAERRPSALRPIDEVKEEITSVLREQAARGAATQKAEELLAALDEGESVEVVANAAGLEWQVELGARRDSQRLPRAVRDELFAMQEPVSGTARRAVINDGRDASYVLEFARLNAGQLTSLPPAEQLQLRERIAGETGGLLQQQYETALRNRADVTVF